jgi:hypothetical protein
MSKEKEIEFILREIYADPQDQDRRMKVLYSVAYELGKEGLEMFLDWSGPVQAQRILILVNGSLNTIML